MWHELSKANERWLDTSENVRGADADTRLALRGCPLDGITSDECSSALKGEPPRLLPGPRDHRRIRVDAGAVQTRMTLNRPEQKRALAAAQVDEAGGPIIRDQIDQMTRPGFAERAIEAQPFRAGLAQRALLRDERVGAGYCASLPAQ
jgi:hypothetical protein